MGDPREEPSPRVEDESDMMFYVDDGPGVIAQGQTSMEDIHREMERFF